MPYATVTVLYVNEPGPGKSYGSVKTQELGYLSVKPHELGLFQKGRRYEIEYVLTDKGYKNFKRINLQAGPPPTSPAKPDEAARLIFITGITGRAMGSGKFEAGDIRNLALEANEAWRALNDLAEAEAAQGGDPRDDEIPF
jgi:hypothetical protein